MASFSVNRAKHATLGVATVDTVTFPATLPYNTVQVINRDATSPIFFSTDGSVPTVAGDDFFCVAPGKEITVGLGGGGAVKLIAAASSAYTVQAR